MCMFCFVFLTVFQGSRWEKKTVGCSGAETEGEYSTTAPSEGPGSHRELPKSSSPAFPKEKTWYVQWNSQMNTNPCVYMRVSSTVRSVSVCCKRSIRRINRVICVLQQPLREEHPTLTKHFIIFKAVHSYILIHLNFGPVPPLLAGTTLLPSQYIIMGRIIIVSYY